jgi:NAD kinase
MSLHGGVVLDSNSKIDLTIRAENPATLSIDGFIDLSMSDLDTVNVVVSNQKVKFLRQPNFETDFWSLITDKLGMRKGNII